MRGSENGRIESTIITSKAQKGLTSLSAFCCFWGRQPASNKSKSVGMWKRFSEGCGQGKIGGGRQQIIFFCQL